MQESRKLLRAKVYFTGLEFDVSAIENRLHKGVIPLEWRRYRFCVDQSIQFPINKINKWLYKNIDGKWASWMRNIDNGCEINIAFERDFDGVTFVLSDGKVEAFKDEN